MTETRKLGLINVVAVLLTMGILASMVFLMVRVDAGNRTIAELTTNYDALRDQLLDENIKPVAPPAEKVNGEPGQRGENGLRGPGPTNTQVQDAVTGFCILRDGCVGPAGSDSVVPGPQGVPGSDSTAPGPQGGTGAPGETGAPGDTGPAGPPGADSSVPGPAGPAGPSGADGRGISSVECADSGDWVITYTDSTTSITPGPCRFIPKLKE